MSLIERAAKRLEQLQRSGAALPESAPGAEAAGRDRLSTPEALLQHVDRSELGLRSNLPSEPRGVAEKAAVAADLPTHSAPPRHRVEIDFARLETQGFVTPTDPQSRIAHEFRVLKRPIIRNANGGSGTPIRNGNLVMVTSSVPGEGKTFIATNLAISIALELDHSAMLVDGDVAHPSVPGVLGTPTAPGLLDLLLDERLDIDDVLLHTNIEKLTVLPAGRPQRNATELLASGRMATLLQKLATRYPNRVIVFDSPPLLPTTEAPVLAAQMGQIVMAVAADSTSKAAVKQALATIERCEVVLMLLNKAVRSDVGSYYGYYADSEKP